VLRTLIVDDHLILRQGLKQLVEGTPSADVTAETCSSQAAVKLIQADSHDVVLLGAVLSGTDHMELLNQIRAAKPKLPVLILSALHEEQYCGRLLRAGASGILVEESASDELVEAIARVSRGRRYITSSLAEVLVDYPADGSTALPDTLSDREYGVMVSIASGKRVKQIAAELSLSVKTISTYHSRILQKLKLDNDAQLIRYAIEQGIVRDGLAAREKLILTHLNLRTAPLIAAVKEIWRLRKAIILVIGALAILTYWILAYAVRVVF
jgi:DNA-binding NarL/FixJ family response regulator